MINIHLIAAARPNFMKIAPLYHALKATDWARPILVHTGQHYDHNMSDAILRDLGIPEPDFHLDIGSGSHAEQTGGVMIAYEKICMEHRPDWIVVVGDVNSTAACAQVGAKLWIPVVHLEAGLRSGDRTMPEEINRLVTDAIAAADTQASLGLSAGEYALVTLHRPSNVDAAETLAENLQTVLAGDWPKGECPPLWDGKTAQRAVECLRRRAIAAA